MQNDRGLTLIEVLASITIASVILGVGFMMFSSVSGTFNNSIHKTQDNNSISSVINAISSELADPTELYLLTENELRFKNSKDEFKALVYENANSLALYTLDSSDASKTIISYPYSAILAKKVLATNIKKDPNIPNALSAFIVQNSSSVPIQAPMNNPITENGLFNILITFEISKITSNGAKTTSYKPLTVNVALSK
jgi:prepilin-type N-terminal cleavage/methylation domain-containing protein